MIRTVGSRRRTARPPVFYWPVAGPFLLAAVVVAVLLIALLQVGIVTYALAGSRVAGGSLPPGSHSPCVTISRHTALVILISRRRALREPTSSGRRAGGTGW